MIIFHMIFQVLDALGESIPCVNYDSWMVYVPEGEFLSRIGPTEFYKVGFLCYCVHMLAMSDVSMYAGSLVLNFISKEY